MLQLGISTERRSRDTTRVNGYGKKLLEICKDNMVYMFNGRVGEDEMIGKETTIHNFIVDYVIG